MLKFFATMFIVFFMPLFVGAETTNVPKKFKDGTVFIKISSDDDYKIIKRENIKEGFFEQGFFSEFFFSKEIIIQVEPYPAILNSDFHTYNLRPMYCKKEGLGCTTGYIGFTFEDHDISIHFNRNGWEVRLNRLSIYKNDNFSFPKNLNLAVRKAEVRTRNRAYVQNRKKNIGLLMESIFNNIVKEIKKLTAKKS